MPTTDRAAVANYNYQFGQALDMMRTACLHLLEARIELLAQRVSLSDRLVDRSPELEAALEQLARRFPEEAARLEQRNPAATRGI